MVEKHIVMHEGIIKKDDRRKLNCHSSFTIWFTGLSGSGKSTIAHLLEEKLHKRSFRTYVLDGDNIRHGLSGNLGFSQEEREENIRRIGEVAKLFIDAGVITIAAFISPYNEDRERVRSMVDKNEFVEVFVKCPLEVCEKRDIKGLYKKARQGVIKQFTGIDDRYDEPINPEIVVETNKQGVEESVGVIIAYLERKGLIEKETT